MIFVGMGNDDRLEVDFLVLNILNVRQHDIDAWELRSRKRHSAVDHDPFPSAFAAVAVKRQVHSDLSNAAEGQENQFVAFAHES